MPTLPQNLANLARPFVASDWYPGGKLDQFIRKIAFQAVDGSTEKVSWNRALTMPTAPLYAISDIGNMANTMMNPDARVDSPMARIGDIVVLDSFQEDASSNIMDMLDVQIAAKKVMIVRQLGTQLFQGTGAASPQDVKGLGTPQQVGGAPANLWVIPSVNATGNALTKEQLHQLVTMVTASDGSVGAGADCIVGNDQAVRGIAKLLEDTGNGTHYVFDSDLGVPVLTFAGVPVYIGQVGTYNTGVSPKTEVFALKLTGRTAVRALHCSGDSAEFGIVAKPVSTPITNAYSAAFVGGLFGLMVPEKESAAKISDILVSNLPA